MLALSATTFTAAAPSPRPGHCEGAAAHSVPNDVDLCGQALKARLDAAVRQRKNMLAPQGLFAVR